MGITRIDNISIVVEDLDAAIQFFLDLGLELEGRTTVEGESVDRLVGLDGVRSEIASVRAPGGVGIELSRFLAPAAKRAAGLVAVNTLGMGRIMFQVDDLDEVVTRMLGRGAELHDEIVTYGDAYRLCYLRGPEGILIALAEKRSPSG